MEFSAGLCLGFCCFIFVFWGIFVLFYFCGRVSQFIPACPGTQFMKQTGLNSQGSPCCCLLRAEIKGVCHYFRALAVALRGEEERCVSLKAWCKISVHFDGTVLYLF